MCRLTRATHLLLHVFSRPPSLDIRLVVLASLAWIEVLNKSAAASVPSPTVRFPVQHTTTTSTISANSTTFPSSPPTETPQRSIAGPVAGGVVGSVGVLAFAVFLTWFIKKKRHNNSIAAHTPGEVQPVITAQQTGYSPGELAGEQIKKNTMSMQFTAAPISELGSWTPGTGGSYGPVPSGSPPPSYPHYSQPVEIGHNEQRGTYP